MEMDAYYTHLCQAEHALREGNLGVFLSSVDLADYFSPADTNAEQIADWAIKKVCGTHWNDEFGIPNIGRSNTYDDPDQL